ncbi:MAG: glycosyltransferase family 2 protein [Cetobacterium sp.]
MLKITVIIPVYNKVKYISRCLKSVLNQSYSNFEIIIVNDGSNDGSKELCEKFALEDSRISLINTKNKGVSSARNIALKIATGDYIQFIDSDDYISEKMFEELVEKVEKEKVEIIISGITKVDEVGNILSEKNPKKTGIRNKYIFFKNFCEEQYSSGLYGAISNKFIKREIIVENNLFFNEEIKLAEDLDFYLNLYEYIDKFCIINKSYYFYIQNTQNSSTSLDFKNDYYIQILILLKMRSLLLKKESLNLENNQIINQKINSFIVCYINDNFTFKYLLFKRKMNLITQNKDIEKSLVEFDKNFQNYFKLKQIKRKRILCLYINLSIEFLIKKLYRRIKY